MSFLRWAEFLFFLLLIITAWTQLIVPLWHGRKIFPFFRSGRKAEDDLETQKERIEALKTQKAAEAERKAADKLERRLNHHDDKNHQ